MRLGTRRRAQREAPRRAARGDVLVEARGVRVERGGRALVDGVDVTARTGELVALIGPNGAGKSTLLSVLAGDLVPDAGDVVCDGLPLQDWAPVELARRRAVLVQSPTVSFPFSCEQVVRLGRAPWLGTPLDGEDDEAVADALRRTDVAHLASRSVATLSGGERARVALARVLAQRTQLVLLDEPTAALDLRHQELVLAVARTLVDTGAGAVVVLHDLSLAAAYADRVVLLSHGRVVADGSPVDVLTSQRLRTVYEVDVDVHPDPRTGAPLVVPVR